MPCALSCTRVGTLITCVVPGTELNRVARGRFDNDGFADLALLQPTNGAGRLSSGAYWLENNHDGGFNVSAIGPVPPQPGKIVVVPGDVRDSVATVHTTRSATGYSPFLPDGGAGDGGMFPVFVLPDDRVDDLAGARLPDWSHDVLALTAFDGGTTSVLTVYPDFVTGQRAAVINVKVGVVWRKVAGWRSWLMVASPADNDGFGVAIADGGIAALTSNLASGYFHEALEVDLNGGGTEFLMRGSTYYSVFEGTNGPPPTNPPVALEVRKSDGGAIPVGLGWTAGSYSFGTTFLALTAQGGLRQFDTFIKGANWRANEVLRPELDGGYVQVELADIDGDTHNDLVLVDKGTGNLRIVLWRP